MSNLSAVGEEQECSCAAVVVWIEAMHVGELAHEKQRQQISSSLPSGKPFSDIKAVDPKHKKAPDKYR